MTTRTRLHLGQFLLLASAAALFLTEVSRAQDQGPRVRFVQQTGQFEESGPATTLQLHDPDKFRNPAPTNGGSSAVPSECPSTGEMRRLPPIPADRQAPAQPAGSAEIPGPAEPRMLPEISDADPVQAANEGADQPPVPLAFHGVHPGRSTQADVQMALGMPLGERLLSGGRLLEYQIEPFNRVDIFLRGNGGPAMVVQSVVIHTDPDTDEKTAVSELGLGGIAPATIFDEKGIARGRAFPEVGVILSFDEHAPSQVKKIILEPLDAKTFVLRAEQRYRTAPLAALRDCRTAASLQPALALAHSQRAVVLASLDEPDEALSACQKALALEPRSLPLTIDRARLYCDVGNYQEASRQAQSVWQQTASDPLSRAEELLVIARATAQGSEQDHRKAVQWAMEAVRLAQEHLTDSRIAVKQAAEEVLLSAHLDIAQHIASGEWKRKPEAVEQWLLRAREVAGDASQAWRSHSLFSTGCVALECCTQLQGKLDPTPWLALVNESGKSLSAQVEDAVAERQLNWKWGVAEANALQTYHLRGDLPRASQIARQAEAHLKAGAQGRDDDPVVAYRVACFYFYRGAIEAIHRGDHAAATQWFEKASPTFTNNLPTPQQRDLARHADRLISMGVSYWEVGEQRKAVKWTTQGARMLEEAVDQGLGTPTALAVPYSNLAQMFRYLGDGDTATKFERLAARHRNAAQR